MLTIRFFPADYSLKVLLIVFLIGRGFPSLAESVLPGTLPLDQQGDLASEMISGVDRFLLQQIEAHRAQRWSDWEAGLKELRHAIRTDQDISGAGDEWFSKKRIRLKETLGIRDSRLPASAIEFIQTSMQPTVIAGSLISSHALPNEVSETRSEYSAWTASLIRLPVLPGVDLEGLLLEPADGQITGNVIVIPDADQLPEQVAGLTDEISEHLQYARKLASRGWRVILPVMISREVAPRALPGGRGVDLSHREFVYRPAFQLGRHIVGYEIQKVLSAVDWLEKIILEAESSDDSEAAGGEAAGNEFRRATPKSGSETIAVVGYGEGGLIALCCAALDSRIDHAFISGFWGPREQMWREPICRNLFGFVQEFGCSELAAMVYPRGLTIDFVDGPDVTLNSRGGAPGKLTPTPIRLALLEMLRTAQLLGFALESPDSLSSTPHAAELGPDGCRWINCAADQPDEYQGNPLMAGLECLLHSPTDLPPVEVIGRLPDSQVRLNRQVDQLIAHTQSLLAVSDKTREEYFSGLDTSSIQAYTQTIEPFREAFYDDWIGRFQKPLLPLNPRSRKSWETQDWTAYEIVLDVWDDVFAYGVLMIPKDISPEQQRPVVVCQHGLEGRPTDVFLGDHPAYHDFAAKLCQRGYIVFAPQNIYIFGDRFRTLQRKANSIGKTLFSVMIPQHEQIVNWLKTLPQVDSEKIAFYGLSYGGKSAMRIPAIIQDYALSICSADFNEWIVKNASTIEPFSYVWTGEYEIFEFNLGSGFGYAEMAALICPRPFMVERGHFDAVAEDHWVAYEYAKVRHLYQARLGIGHLTEIEWFPGPHTINGKGTFEFLDKHLQWTNGH